MKIEVSKMTRLLTVTREREFSRVLPHQFLESLQRHDLPERYMHRLSPGFHAENFRASSARWVSSLIDVSVTAMCLPSTFVYIG